jgi:hypothetical protein
MVTANVTLTTPGGTGVIPSAHPAGEMRNLGCTAVLYVWCASVGTGARRVTCAVRTLAVVAVVLVIV